MNRSRVTLARTDAAATGRQKASAFTRISTRGLGHAQIVALGFGDDAYGPGIAPRGDLVEDAFSFDLAEHLGVAHTVHPAVAWQHRGADGERAGPGTPPDLVDPDDHLATLVPQFRFEAAAWRVLA
jgi:hypothetical protein